MVICILITNDLKTEIGISKRQTQQNDLCTQRRLTTNPTRQTQQNDLFASRQTQQNDLCAQRRPRSTWASAQSDQSLCCPHEESLGHELSIERTANADLSLRLARSHFVGFVMRRLIFLSTTEGFKE